MAEEMDFMMDDDDGILDYDDGDDLDFSTDNEEEDEESIIVWVNYINRFVLKYEFFQSGFDLLVFLFKLWADQTLKQVSWGAHPHISPSCRSQRLASIILF